MIKGSAKPKGKPGRKASGLRGLTPEQARHVVSKAALKAVREAVALQGRVVKETGMAGGVPTLERLLRGDVEMTQVLVAEEGEVHLRPAMMTASLETRLEDAGLSQRLAWVAGKFVADVEGVRIGKLTASYGEGTGGGQADEALRVVIRMRRLVAAQAMLTPKERTAVWGLLVFGLNMTDVGWALAGDRFGARGEPLRNASALLLEGALERMAPHYEARG